MANVSRRIGMGWLIGVLTVMVPLAACEQGPSPEVEAELAELESARDSLNRELAEQTERIQGLSQRIEEAVGAAGEPGAAGPEGLEDRIAGMREELETARSQLADARGQIRALNTRSSALRDSLDTVITDRDEALATQRDSIQGLAASLDSMTDRADGLANDREGLTETLDELERKYYTVYYAVGTEDELIERGIVEREGGARVLLLLWKAGETLVASRDLASEQFEAMDLRENAEIPLPGPGSYRVVSRHSTEYLEPTPDEEGRFRAERLRITQPEEFWQSSRYLIVVAH